LAKGPRASHPGDLWTPALPVILPYARAIADALLSLIAMLFLISRHGESDWDWLSRHTPA
jgi:hypothetical protein